ncbi:hypothetical protein BH10PLA2_BH10PLA2_09260 [soil metagenome]
MSCQPETSEPTETIADLLSALGGIGPERLLLRGPIGMATEEDVIVALAAPRKRICELIEGILVEKAPGFRESVLGARVMARLGAFVELEKPGVISDAAGTIRLWPGRVRIPDVAFCKWHRFPEGRVPEEPIPLLVPDLAIHILRAGNSPEEMALRRKDYFAVNVPLVWEIDPSSRTAQVYTSDSTPGTMLNESEALDGAPVLPGFSLSLHDLFGCLDGSD